VLESRLNAQGAQIELLRDEVREMRRDLYRPRSNLWENAMLLSDLTARLQSSLNDAASVFEADDFTRHVNVALRAMALHKRPLRRVSTLDLVADQWDYAAPADLVRVERLHWTNQHAREPWHSGYLGAAPVVSHLQGVTGLRLNLSPAPSQRQVAALDGKLRFTYRAEHVIDSGEVTTLADGDADLVVLRAQAEACRELAMRAISKPVTIRDGGLSQPRNGTPGALYRALLAEWETAA